MTIKQEKIDVVFKLAKSLNEHLIRSNTPLHEFVFIYDTHQLSTSLDADQAWYLLRILQQTQKILEAIIDLYTADVTGCIDSELL